MAAAPQTEVILLGNGPEPHGLCEPSIAPAVANAVYALTGQRSRRLPLRFG